jgi:EAL domain-containing protein (putative c-di-GMP-specific phosphodiesterase class I)
LVAVPIFCGLNTSAVVLNWAKADGKGRWRVFDPERNAREVARYTLAAAMPGALERGEFRLVYQPIVDLATGTPCGVEALARWSHPELGLLNPDRFIELAEDRGPIVALGLRPLEQACREAAGWGGEGPYVSVNLAVRQIRHPGLVAEVVGILDRTGLPPARLQLEITESAVMDTDDDTLATLCQLARLGVRLAIDDFGTGYSNLAYLRTLPVQGLKLAGPFVEGLGTPAVDPTDEAILSTLVTLGHTLGLVVTAEGMENQVQAERLRGRLRRRAGLALRPTGTGYVWIRTDDRPVPAPFGSMTIDCPLGTVRVRVVEVHADRSSTRSAATAVLTPTVRDSKDPRTGASSSNLRHSATRSPGTGGQAGVGKERWSR